MTSVERQEAAAALDDIEQIGRRVRQSRIYNLAVAAVNGGGLVSGGLWMRRS